MDFVTRLPIFTNWKDETNNTILVILDRLTNMIDSKLVKVTIDESALTKVIILTVVRYHSLPDSIVNN